MEKKQHVSTCAIHRGEKCKYYCMEEKCDRALCQMCITKHQGHRVKPIEIAMLEKKKRAEKAKHEVKSVSPEKKEVKKVQKVAVPPVATK